MLVYFPGQTSHLEIYKSATHYALHIHKSHYPFNKFHDVEFIGIHYSIDRQNSDFHITGKQPCY